MLLGRSIIGVRASDVLRLVATVRGRDDIENDGLVGVARRELGPVLQHAAAFEPDAFSRIALFDPLSSYASLVEQEHYPADWIHASVPGVIAVYDLPDLTPRPLLPAGISELFDSLTP